MKWFALSTILVEQFVQDLDQAIAPKHVVAARNSYGGTGFEQVRLAIADAKQLMD